MNHELLLSKEVYSKSDLQIAMDAYRSFADISIFERDQYWQIDFAHCKYGAERTMKEFENYMIGLANQ